MTTLYAKNYQFELMYSITRHLAAKILDNGFMLQMRRARKRRGISRQAGRQAGRYLPI